MGDTSLFIFTVAALIEGVILQPTLYWKNARAQKLPFTLNPRILYRGTAISIFNECQLMGIQFSVTSYFQRKFDDESHSNLKNQRNRQNDSWNGNNTIVSSSSSSSSVSSMNRNGPDTVESENRNEAMNMLLPSLIGGVVSAFSASPVELVGIQQQLHGGSMFYTSYKIIKTYGWQAMLRGLIPAIIRDGLYVTGMLGVVPMLQDYFMLRYQMHLETAGLYASIIGGVAASLTSQPFDLIKTNMQGDVGSVKYKGFVHTLMTLYHQDGIKRFYRGAAWRAVNIVGTIYIANECRVHLPAVLFPKRENRLD